jgi:hypothetical protein
MSHIHDWSEEQCADETRELNRGRELRLLRKVLQMAIALRNPVFQFKFFDTPGFLFHPGPSETPLRELE